MAVARDPSLRGLNDCGCCEGVSLQIPVLLANRPGLSGIAYRIGTHQRFVRSMLAHLSSARHPRLRELTTRDADDPTIALLDACAAVDDVLTFYQERYAHESYLRTSTERVSLVHLARLIGYEPRPGVAANTYLAFTIEDTPGSPEKTYIDAGTQVQSIPGPNELPQTFETMQGIEARSAWNAMKARTKQPHPLNTGLNMVTVRGLEVGVRRGDSLLIVAGAGAAERAVKRVKRVTPNPVMQTTEIELDAPPPPSSPPPVVASTSPFSFGLGALGLTNATLARTFHGQVFSQGDTYAFAASQNWAEADYTVAFNRPQSGAVGPPDTGVFALRQRAAIFGHNAPRWANLPQVVVGRTSLIPGKNLTAADKPNAQYPDDWDNLTLDQSPNIDRTIDLDNSYPAMVGGSWLVLESPVVSATSYRVQGNQELTRSDYTISAKVTRLILDREANFGNLKMRDTTALGQSEELNLADVPVGGPLAGNTVVLDQYYPGLMPGQTVIISGRRDDLAGVPGREARVLRDVLVDGTLETGQTGRLFTRLIFDRPLDVSYVLETVTISANVALATHGERKAEVLGSGDARQRYPTFVLKQPPLTYTSAPTPTGAQSSLEVRVDDILWQEVPNLHGGAADAHVYVVRTEDDGTTYVRFRTPLPTGQENIRARYRKGIGLAGMVHADQLTLLAVRPLGVRSVTNPLPASGAEEPESRDAVRSNAPLTVLTMDRLVALQDYEDFVRAFAGFAKARATLTMDGERQRVFVTVAGANGAEVSETSPEYRNLLTAMRRFGDPNTSFVVKSYRRAFFQVEANVGVDPAYLPDKAVEAVRAALRQRFSFEARQFGQSVTKSEVIATIQRVPGVVFVDLNALFPTNATQSREGVVIKTLNDQLSAAEPRSSSRGPLVEPAELLLLDPRPVQIGVISP
jgi:predicted phage baseplate assembly protein